MKPLAPVTRTRRVLLAACGAGTAGCVIRSAGGVCAQDDFAECASCRYRRPIREPAVAIGNDGYRQRPFHLKGGIVPAYAARSVRYVFGRHGVDDLGVVL